MPQRNQAPLLVLFRSDLPERIRLKFDFPTSLYSQDQAYKSIQVEVYSFWESSFGPLNELKGSWHPEDHLLLEDPFQQVTNFWICAWAEREDSIVIQPRHH